MGKSEGNPEYGQNRHNWFFNTWTTRSGWSIERELEADARILESMEEEVD